MTTARIAKRLALTAAAGGGKNAGAGAAAAIDAAARAAAAAEAAAPRASQLPGLPGLFLGGARAAGGLKAPAEGLGLKGGLLPGLGLGGTTGLKLGGTGSSRAAAAAAGTGRGAKGGKGSHAAGAAAEEQFLMEDEDEDAAEAGDQGWGRLADPTAGMAGAAGAGGGRGRRAAAAGGDVDMLGLARMLESAFKGGDDEDIEDRCAGSQFDATKHDCVLFNRRSPCRHGPLLGCLPCLSAK